MHGRPFGLRWEAKRHTALDASAAPATLPRRCDRQKQMKNARIALQLPQHNFCQAEDWHDSLLPEGGEFGHPRIFKELFSIYRDE
jgi:hypothetical protein